MKPIRVLIIDDSALIRKMMSEMLGADPGIEVVATAPDPIIAEVKIKQLHPDVLTLDVEMPRMDGLTFLEKLMSEQPMPVLMVSSLTARGAEVTFKALELGAVDFISKPGSDLSRTFSQQAEHIISKVKAAARARPRSRIPSSGTVKVTPKLNADAVLPKPGHLKNLPTAGHLLAIGASAGGTEAIRVVLEQMPPDAPPIVITQHIPAAFSGPFAERMNRCSAMRVFEAQDAQPILPGHAYIAPGGKHLLVMRDGARFVCRLHDGPPVSRHKPSVDVLFRSVAVSAGGQAIGAILTGMGADGAQGLKELRDTGSPTLAQDEASSVVWGMPGAAWKLGAAMELVPIERMASRLLQLAVAGPAQVRPGTGR